MKRDEVPSFTLLRDSIGDTFMQCPRVYPGNGKIKKRTPKSNLSGEPEGVKGAIGKPPCRARRREIPAPSCQNQATLL